MEENEFIKIFTDLEQVESELKCVGSDQEKRKKCYNRLLALRNRMDRCVEFWLRFEERINDLQERFDFLLPDELPESFYNVFGLRGSVSETFNPEEEKKDIIPASLDSNHEASIRTFRRGLGFLELAMMDEAIAEFRQVIKEEPDLLLARLCLGVAYAERGMADEAMRELRLVRALCDDPQAGAIVHNAMGNVYADQEQYEPALEEFSKVLELDQDFAVAHFNLGAVYYNLQQYDKSIAAFEAVKEIFPKDWEIYFYLGKAYKKTDNDKKALENLLKASCLAPWEPYVAFELGLLYETLGETRKALEYCYKARRLYKETDDQENGSQ